MSRPAPVLSVVIAAFDAESTLDAQLDALLAEPVPFGFEILVCDNGSRDGTRQVVERRRAQRPEVVLVDASARRGPSAARNIGVGAARGTFVAFCDADDVVGTGWLAAMHDALLHDDFVTGSWEGDLLNQDNRASVSWNIEGLITEPYFPWLPATGSGNMGVRRSVFTEVGGFEESLATAEDVDFSWRVQLAGHRLVYQPQIVLHVRKRDGLRAVFRQAYSYGVGDKQLRRRYARVADAYRRLGSAHDPPSGDAPPESGAAHRDELPADPSVAGAGPTGAGRSSSLRRAVDRVVRKVAKGRRGWADTLWRVGQWCGDRFGRVPGDVDVVPIPPGGLPRPR